MSRELPPNKKEVASKELVDGLRERGFQDPGVKEMLSVWVRENEAELNLDPAYTSRVEMDRRRARLFFSAGCIDEAFESMNMAATQADNEGNIDLYTSVMAEMDEMDGKLNP